MKKTLKIVIQVFLESTMMGIYLISGLVIKLLIRKNTIQYPSHGRTIVFVERWLNKNIIHQYWMIYLRKKGFSIHLISLSLFKDSFEKSAQELESYMRKNNLKDITLVGISSGGISCLEYLQNYSGWERVSRFISIGTPFKGTDIASLFFFFKPARELIPSSTFMTNLSKSPVTNLEHITCLVAKVDQLVPRSSGCLKGAQQKVVDVYGHNNLHLYSKETYDIVAKLAK